MVYGFWPAKNGGRLEPVSVWTEPVSQVDPLGLSGIRLPRIKGHWDDIHKETNWYSYKNKVNSVISN